MERKKLVVGGSYQAFIEWCRGQGISPNQAWYAGDDPHKVMGLELQESDIVRWGGVSAQMEQLLRTRIR